MTQHVGKNFKCFPSACFALPQGQGSNTQISALLSPVTGFNAGFKATGLHCGKICQVTKLRPKTRNLSSLTLPKPKHTVVA